MTKVEKFLAVIVCVAVCVQRLSMAAGSILWGISIALFLYFLYKHYKHNDLKCLTENCGGYYKAFAVFAICAVPAVFSSNCFDESLHKFLEMYIYRVMPFFIVTLFIKDMKWLKNIFLIFLFITGIDSIVALAQVLLNMTSRGWGFGGHSLNLASLLCVVIPIFLVALLDDRFSKRTKLICKLAILFCVIGIFAGKSRGAWLTLAIVLPLVSYSYVIKSKKAIAGTLIICLMIGSFFAISDTYRNRLTSTTNITTDWSNVDRLLIWRSTINMVEDYPFFGVGLDQFKKVYDAEYKNPKHKQNLPHTHNNIVQIAAESGLVGLFGFLYLACYIFFKNFNEWRKTKNPYSLMLWGAWLGFMIFGMFDLTIDHSAITKAMWFLFGCILVFKNKDYYI